MSGGKVAVGKVGLKHGDEKALCKHLGAERYNALCNALQNNERDWWDGRIAFGQYADEKKAIYDYYGVIVKGVNDHEASDEERQAIQTIDQSNKEYGKRNKQSGEVR